MFAIPTPCGPPRWTWLPEGIEGWLVTRYADGRAVLSDARLVRDPVVVSRLRAAAGVMPTHGGGRVGRGVTLLHMDPPVHTRVRRAIAPSFTVRRAQAAGSVIDELATTLVRRCRSSGRADLVCDLAVPLAVGVLCRITGLPACDHVRFGPWVRQVHRIDGGAETGQRIHEAIAAMDRYLEGKVGDDQRSGVLHELRALADTAPADTAPGDPALALSDDEVIALSRDLLVGGYESTASLISGCIALLLADPARYEEARSDPELIGPAVEEALRQVAPFPRLEARYAAEPLTIGGVRIAVGDAVVVDVAAANRDADRFPAGARWSLANATGHLSFGHGAHHCIGAALARREAQAALVAVLNLTDLRLACAPDELVWAPGLVPMLRELPVRFTPVTAGSVADGA